MTNTQIKLILMNYSEGEYIPELGGIYINNIIIPLKSDIFGFIRKYNLDIQFKYFLHNDQDIDRAIHKLSFHMNLLNFNSYSSWQIMLISTQLFKLTPISPFIQYIQYFNIKSQTFQRYIIYRKI
jgi:hypothetical protein